MLIPWIQVPEPLLWLPTNDELQLLSWNTFFLPSPCFCSECFATTQEKNTKARSCKCSLGAYHEISFLSFRELYVCVCLCLSACLNQCACFSNKLVSHTLYKLIHTHMQSTATSFVPSWLLNEELFPKDIEGQR